MRVLQGFLQAMSMYTVLPLPGLRWDSRADRHILACFPAAGLVIGGLWYLLARLTASLPLMPGAALVTAAPFLLSGFLHLDGFMDVCDAVLSRRDRTKRLEILKDPHTGAFAVIAVCLLLMTEFSAVCALLEEGELLFLLAALPVLSRGWAGLSLACFPLLEGSAMGAWVRKDITVFHRIFLVLAALLAGAAMTAVCGWRGAAAAAAGTAGCLLTAWRSVKQLGGVSGDTSGCALTVGELLALLTAALI